MAEEFKPPLIPPDPPKKPKKRKGAKGIFAGKVDLEKDYRRIMTVLSREVAYLMMESHQASLTEERSKALVAYSKLIRDLRNTEMEAPKEIPADVLAEKANKDSSTK